MANPVVRWQIVARDPAEVAAFYHKLFGWSVDSGNALGYREIRTGNDRGIDGGVWPSPPGNPSFVQLFVEVDDVDASITKAAALGASVIVPKAALPGGDTMAVLLGPCGITFGIMERKTSAS